MDSEHLDELMNCDDIWEDEDFTRPRSPSAISEDSATTWCSFSGESILTYASWGSCTDSEISEVIAPSYQNVDEEIRRVCFSFLNSENLEIEEDEEDDIEIEPSSRLSIKSEESESSVSGVFSSSTTTAITTTRR